MEDKNPVEVSVIAPSRNEGEKVNQFLEELIAGLQKTGRSYEIIAINAPSQNNSYETFKKYAQQRDNFYAIDLAVDYPSGTAKGVQYMLGFGLAKGRYIVQIDTDLQDDPAEISKFLQKLDEGYDVVVGSKQNRKDGVIYVFTSRISNFLARTLTGITLTDMNCGFKAYKAEAIKSLRVPGRLYRYIPSLLNQKGFKITEVPYNHRKREWGTSNFNFFNRMQGGVFDLLLVFALNLVGETPVYFFGWLSVGLFMLFLLFLLTSIFISGLYWQLLTLGLALLSLAFLGLSMLAALCIEYFRYMRPVDIKQYAIRESYPEIQ